MSSARFVTRLKEAALLALPVFMPFMGGCTENTSGTEREGARVRMGLLTLDRSEAGEVSESEATARFIQTRGAPDERALHLGGFALALPLPQTCIVLQRNSARSSQPVQHVMFSDVGNVVLTSKATPAMSIAMQSRVIPDFSGLVEGFMYFAGAVPLHAGAPLDVALDGVQASVVVPDRLRVQLSTAQGVLRPGQALILPRRGLMGEAISIEWNTVAESFVFVDVLAAEGGPALRCALSASDGASAVMSSDVLGGAAKGHLRFHRITRQTRTLHESDTLEVRFDDTLTFAFERP
jgi:hypothetical protein